MTLEINLNEFTEIPNATGHTIKFDIIELIEEDVTNFYIEVQTIFKSFESTIKPISPEVFKDKFNKGTSALQEALGVNPLNVPKESFVWVKLATRNHYSPVNFKKAILHYYFRQV